MSKSTGHREWYAVCKAFPSLPEVFRRKASRQTRASYHKVSRLPDAVGEELDRRLAPLFVMRWIAWAETHDAILARNAAALAYHDRTRRWPPENELGKLGENVPSRG
jgi:hypothetical protein